MNRKRKHIVFISSWYPTLQDPTLGIFNRYFAVAAALYNQVTVLHIKSEQHCAQEFAVTGELSDNVTTITVPYKKVKGNIPVLSSLKRRNKVLKAAEIGFQFIIDSIGKPDLVQLNVAMPMGLPVLHLHRKYKIPYVVNENWSGYCAEDGAYKGFMQTYFTQKIVASAKAILPTSSYLAEAMQAHHLHGNYKVVPNVVNTNLFRPIETPPHQGIRFIHISSLNDREKNISGLLRAFALASKQRSDLELNLIGDSDERSHLQHYAVELGIGNRVNFKGRKFKEELVQEINEADAHVMFSHFETFCLVNIEAFACGKPVISSAAGGIKTYLTPQLGSMVPVGDEKALAEALLSFAAQPKMFDAQKIAAYAVATYSYQTVGKQLDEIYSEVLIRD